jgi:hypothetical protein
LEFDCNIFKKVAEEMGIEWDENAHGTTVNGKPVDPSFFMNLFSANERNEKNEQHSTSNHN